MSGSSPLLQAARLWEETSGKRTRSMQGRLGAGQVCGRMLLPLTIFLTLSARAAAATPSEDASTKIEEGMTVEQVGNAIGFRPTTVEEHACGDGDTTPFWFCRIQTYADGKHTLVVYFNKLTVKPTWAVRSWIMR
jgi:hypothetical protein